MRRRWPGFPEPSATGCLLMPLRAAFVQALKAMDYQVVPPHGAVAEEPAAPQAAVEQVAAEEVAAHEAETADDEA